MTGAHEVLIGHHRALRTMMRRFDELFSAPEPDRRQLLNTLSAELQIPEQIEDELYYPAVRDLTPLIWLAHAEHRQLEDQLAVVLRTPLNSEPFPDQWRTLVHTLEGHATEEETGMFPQAGAYLGPGRLQALARRCKPAKPSSAAPAWSRHGTGSNAKPCAACNHAGTADSGGAEPPI